GRRRRLRRTSLRAGGRALPRRDNGPRDLGRTALDPAEGPLPRCRRRPARKVNPRARCRIGATVGGTSRRGRELCVESGTPPRAGTPLGTSELVGRRTPPETQGGLLGTASSKPRATITDVAKAAGVSIKTV